MPDWTILLIGGSSATGKTTLARALAQAYGVSGLLIDDIRMAIQQIATPAQHPTLHRFLSDHTIWSDADAICDAQIAIAEALEPAIAMVMAHHLVVAGVGPVIIEGDSILPRLVSLTYAATLPQLQGVSLAGRVRGLLLTEPEEIAILAAMHGRGRGFDQHPEIEQQSQAHGSWLYGSWLRAEAERYSTPVLPARPYDTVMTRALEAIRE